MSAVLHITLCWVDSPGCDQIAGEPAFDVAGVDSPRLRSRGIAYRGTPTLDALMAEPALADIAARVASGAWRIAIFGKPARAAMPIYDGDRIELLEPITADPKSARRARVLAERDRLGAGRWQRGRN